MFRHCSNNKRPDFCYKIDRLRLTVNSLPQCTAIQPLNMRNGFGKNNGIICAKTWTSISSILLSASLVMPLAEFQLCTMVQLSKILSKYKRLYNTFVYGILLKEICRESEMEILIWFCHYNSVGKVEGNESGYKGNTLRHS